MIGLAPIGRLFVAVSMFLLVLGFAYNDRVDMLIAWAFLALAFGTLRAS